MTSVAVVVITKNEGAAIQGCLRSAEALGPMWVLDSQSEDSTQALARELGATVVDFIWSGHYPKKKQAALDMVPAEFDWVLILDADERLTASLIDEVQELIKEAPNDLAAIEFPLAYYWRGKELKHGYRVIKRSLVRRSVSRYPDVMDETAPGITEVEGHYQPQVDGRIVRTVGRLVHNDPDPIATWVDRHNRYSDWEAWLTSEPATLQRIRGYRSRQGRLFAQMPIKPITFFLYAYFYKRGFLDGRAGFDYAVANSFYYWLTSVKVNEKRN